MNFTHSKRNSIQKIYKNQFDSIYNPPGTNLPAYLNFIPLPSLASATFLPNASLNAAIFSFFGTAANTADTRFHPLTKSIAPGTMPAYANKLQISNGDTVTDKESILVSSLLILFQSQLK